MSISRRGFLSGAVGLGACATLPLPNMPIPAPIEKPKEVKEQTTLIGRCIRGSEISPGDRLSINGREYFIREVSIECYGSKIWNPLVSLKLIAI